MTSSLSDPKAVVLLSGGLDSYTAAAIAKGEGFDLYALTVGYGQRHSMELDAARRVASALGVVVHREMSVDLASFGGSALTGQGEVPKDRPITLEQESDEIPVTYVPARNTILLSLALAWAETIGSHDLVIGVNALDYSGYPDCRPEYIAAFEQLASVATRAGVGGNYFRVRAPLLEMNKADIVREGERLGLDYGLTHSCYEPLRDNSPCGRCDSCQLRAKGFAEAGVRDPLVI